MTSVGEFQGRKLARHDAVQERSRLFGLEAFELIDGGAGEQCAHHFKGRVLGRGAHEDEETRFDVRQEGVLLTLVEAMDFVDEEQRRAARRLSFGLREVDRLADVLETSENRGNRKEGKIEGVRHEAGERRLADTRRAPEDHRVGTVVFKGDAKRRTRSDQMLLSHDLVERLRAHALRQGRERGLGGVVSLLRGSFLLCGSRVVHSVEKIAAHMVSKSP